MAAYAHVGDFCPNEACPDYGKLPGTHVKKNIKKHGHSRNGRQRYQCTTCGQTFTETHGTLFYRRRTPESEIVEVLAMLAEGMRISRVSRVKGHKEATILSWLRQAAAHAQAVEEVLMADYQVTRGQVEALWSSVGQKGEKNYAETPDQGTFWRATLIDMDTRLRAARGIGKTEPEAAQEAFEALRRRGHPEVPPPTVSDGRGGIGEAMVEVWGQIPPYSGRGRPPTRKRAQAGWTYLQIVKRRKNGRVVRTHKRVIYGEEEEVLELFGGSTAYVERTHLTSRLFNGRLVRKTLGFSKELEMHRASTIWEDVIYNLVRPLKTLRLRIQGDSSRRWLPRTPAMAAGLTDHLWTIRELLTTLPAPSPSNA